MSMPQLSIAAVAAAAVLLAGCTPPNENDSTAPKTTQASAAAQASTAASATATDSALRFEDAVVRATDDDATMTAIFGTLINDGDEDITVVGFSTSADAAATELHEVVNGTMQQMTEPLVIPAGGSQVLEPGKEHLMLLGLGSPIRAGESISIMLELADGATVTFDTIPARDMGAGDEDYAHDHDGHGDHDGHDHDDDDDEDGHKH